MSDVASADGRERGADRSLVRSLAGRLAARLAAEQDRWFLWVPVLYGTGVALYFALPVEPDLVPALAILTIAIVAQLVLTRGTLTIVATGMALAIALGFAAAKLRTMWVDAPVLQRQLTGAEVRGWVELVEPRPGRGERLTLRVSSIRGVAKPALPLRVRVTTRKALAGLAPGIAVRLTATLAPPPIPAFPGGYDFARAAFFQQLGGVGYSLSSPSIDTQAGPAPLMLQVAAAIAQVRQTISRRVRAGLAGERGAIADALITGERGGISEATNNAYRGSGIFHILSISGLHMTVMAGAVFFALRFALAAIPAIALSQPIKKWAAVMATLAAFGYLMISGAAFATVRSWVMITVMFVAVLLDRPAVTLRNVAVSALLILLVIPESLLDIGFQMSYAAVVALVSAYEALRMRARQRDGGSNWRGVLAPLAFLGGIILTTLIASVAVAPFGIYHFHNSQQYAVLANLIAIPVCNVLVMPAALATLLALPFGLEAAPLWVMGFGIDAMNWCAYRVAALPGAVAKVPAIPVAAFALMVLGGIWLCIWRTRWRLLGIAAIAAGAAAAPSLARPDVMVGSNGYLVAVRAPSGELMVEAGRRTRFELSRWLENDGDSRPPQEVAKQGGFRCDLTGCLTATSGVVVALARHHSALADDCPTAGLLILTFSRPAACVREGPVIDAIDLREEGTHAIYLDRAKPGAIERIETVAGSRGDRPWTSNETRRRRSSPVGAGWLSAGSSASTRSRRGTPSGVRATPRTGTRARSRTGLFAAPVDLAADPADLRPEEADQDGMLAR